MTVKLIAVDMDGTFLNEEKKYNKQRFLQQYQQLKERGIHFVVASGNQLYTLKNYFPEIANEISYVAENGAFVMSGTEEIHFSHFSQKIKEQLLTDLIIQYEQATIVCGKKGAYISQKVPQSDMPKLNKYFKRLTSVENLLNIDDEICKVTINTQHFDFDTLQNALKKKTYIEQQQVKMVSSGFGFIDLIVPKKHKAYGLAFLQKQWQVADHEILAIGDNNNDIEMVEKAGYGIAMKNAVDELKDVASYVVRSNEEEGVLNVLDCVLHAQNTEDLIHQLTKQE